MVVLGRPDERFDFSLVSRSILNCELSGGKF